MIRTCEYWFSDRRSGNSTRPEM